MSEQNQASVVEEVEFDDQLSPHHLEVLEFLFSELPARVDYHHLETPISIFEQARNGVARHKNILFFTNFQLNPAPSALVTAPVPLLVWKDGDSVSVGLDVRKGHEPLLVPELRKLLDDLMTPPTTTDQVDVSLFFTVWKHRISSSDIAYLWLRATHSLSLPEAFHYYVKQESQWAYLYFRLSGEESEKFYVLGVMTGSLLRDHRYGPELTTRIFVTDRLSSSQCYAVDPAVLKQLAPVFRKRISDIKSAMQRVLLENEAL